ncbi:DUF2752 domain-containing protein [Flaviaesturariibacter aridisoli]|uniref:DUF2752 domain-containing protein n=1 Tax=Flaviaesturariibacter aridisoli TaxID=2545761 RepID=A0A4R4E1L1_9BACT|nr:DUF2752 domain-containing protein [Flaviaesturariibacter aridisoli]TCZ73316.1 DUF2752 domain-containing protein [Flaviaesturariibacter aridisoli]
MRQRRNVWYLMIGAALVAASVIYYRFPADRYAYPGCWFRALTGLYCPACGGQRSFSALLHGHLNKAFRYNALFVALLPVALMYCAWRFLSPKRLSLSSQTRIALSVCAVVLLFGILRNVPALHLAP